MFRQACLYFALLSAAFSKSPELHVSRLGDSPDYISLVDSTGKSVRLEVAREHFMTAKEVTLKGRLLLQSETDETSQEIITLGELVLPTEGRHLLLLSPDSKIGIRTNLLPVDTNSFPPGSAAFLNLTDREVRCTIDEGCLDLKPGGYGRIASADASRIAVNHKLYLKVGKSWVQKNATTLMIGPRRRCLIILTQVGPGDQISRGLIMDTAPIKHLAQLLELSDTVKAEPTLPDPPAK